MTNTAYLVGFRGRKKLIAIRVKFAAVCRGILQTGPRIWKNLLRKTAIPNHKVPKKSRIEFEALGHLTFELCLCFFMSLPCVFIGLVA